MKKSILSVAAATFTICLLLVVPTGVMAQTFTTLHNFTALNNSTNNDGATPVAGLILLGNTLYGTAQSGGRSGVGSVFAVNTDGMGFTNLHSFSGLNNSTNSDGAYPYAGLILSGNTLYGTASSGGNKGKGTVYKVNTDGTGFTNLHNFAASSGVDSTNSDGANPHTGLILSGNALYGTANFGGSRGRGTVYKVNTDGTGFTNLHSFAGGTFGDGAFPNGLIFLDNTLCGTSYSGGDSGYGTVFKINTNGTGFAILYNFTADSGSPFYTNSDGAYPDAGLILSGNTLYGTANLGGISGNGTVFKLNTDGTGFTNLHSFTGSGDGSLPRAGLILSGNTLYGTAQSGGSSGVGSVFAVNIDGTGFTNLHSFTGSGGGANPYAGLISSGNTLYGTAAFGGSSGSGVVFGLNLAPVIVPGISVSNVSVVEGQSGTTGAVFPVSLNSTSTVAVSVNFTTTDGIATVVDNDYISTNGVITFAPGESNKTITVLVNGDTKVESNETFFIMLSNPTNATLSTPQATGTILNDDVSAQPPEVSAIDVSWETTPVGSSQNDASLGWEFIVSVNVRVTALGIFDDGQDGLLQSHRIGIWNTNGTLIVETNIPSGVNATLIDGFRFVAINETSLVPGRYVIGAQFTAASSDKILGDPTNATPATGIAFVQPHYGLGTNLPFPNVGQGGTGKNHFGPNFRMLEVGPSISVSLASTDILLSWASSSLGFRLETTVSLLPPIVWTAVTNTPDIVSNKYQVTLTRTNGSQFFRLRNP